jgi:hypothetical protein
MKRKLLLFPLCAAMGGLMLSSNASGPYNVSRENRTGAGGTTASCAGGSCHGANSAATNVTISVTDAGDNPVTSYTPGTTYTVHVKGTNSGSLFRFGFQSTAVLVSNTNTQAGAFTGSADISVRTGVSPNIVEHNKRLTGTVSGSTGSMEAVYNWTAPAAGRGAVRFYATLNAVNADNTTTGDAPNTATPIDLAEAGGTNVPGVSTTTLKLYPNPATSSIRLELPDAVQQGTYQIRDIRGSIVSRGDLQISQGGAKLGLEALAAGAYFVQVQAAGGTMVAPFVKQ